jgi:hypothetical protein
MNQQIIEDRHNTFEREMKDIEDKNIIINLVFKTSCHLLKRFKMDI